MKNNNKGYTLLELLIIIAIVAILIQSALPSFQTHIDKARALENQAQEMESLLRALQSDKKPLNASQAS